MNKTTEELIAETNSAHRVLDSLGIPRDEIFNYSVSNRILSLVQRFIQSTNIPNKDGED